MHRRVGSGTALAPVAAAALSLIVACGGGGGGGESSSGLDLSTHSAAFAMLAGGAYPSAQSIEVRIRNPAAAYVAAGYVDPYPGQPRWLSMLLEPDGDHFDLGLSIADVSPPGHYTTTFQVGIMDESGELLGTEDVQVTFDVTAFCVFPEEVLLGGADGLAAPLQDLTVTVDAGDGLAYPFTVALETDGGEPWLGASAASGSAGVAGATVQLRGDPEAVQPGTYGGQALVTINVRGVSYSQAVRVTYNREVSRLVVGAAGIGLTAAPDRPVLERDVIVYSSIGRADVPWAAASDQAWLAVTPSGTTGQALHLAADPAGLAAGQTHFATVTITSPDAMAANQQTVRVGLHVRTTAAADVSAAGAPTGYLAASPVEPVVFLSDGGADVVGYDVTTGSAVRTFGGVATAARALTLSGDGRLLFVHDAPDGPSSSRVVVLDAASGELVRTLDVPFTPNREGALLTARPGGREVLVTPGAQIFDVGSGEELSTLRFAPPAGAYSLAVSPDQRHLILDAALVYGLRLSDLYAPGVVSEVEFAAEGLGGGPGAQACVSGDGTTIWATGWTLPAYGFTGTSLATHEVVHRLPGKAYPNAVACAWNGLVVAGMDAYYDPTDLRIYDGRTGELVAELRSADRDGYRGLAARGLALSADGSRLISVVPARPYDGRVDEARFQTMPPLP